MQRGAGTGPSATRPFSQFRAFLQKAMRVADNVVFIGLAACWSGSTVRRPPWPVFAQSRRAISTNSGGYRRQTGECNLLASSSIILTEGSCSTNAARRFFGMSITASSTMRSRRISRRMFSFPHFAAWGFSDRGASPSARGSTGIGTVFVIGDQDREFPQRFR